MRDMVILFYLNVIQAEFENFVTIPEVRGNLIVPVRASAMTHRETDRFVPGNTFDYKILYCYIIRNCRLLIEFKLR